MVNVIPLVGGAVAGAGTKRLLAGSQLPQWVKSGLTGAAATGTTVGLTPGAQAFALPAAGLGFAGGVGSYLLDRLFTGDFSRSERAPAYVPNGATPAIDVSSPEFFYEDIGGNYDLLAPSLPGVTGGTDALGFSGFGEIPENESVSFMGIPQNVQELVNQGFLELSGTDDQGNPEAIIPGPRFAELQAFMGGSAANLTGGVDVPASAAPRLVPVTQPNGDVVLGLPQAPALPSPVVDKLGQPRGFTSGDLIPRILPIGQPSFDFGVVQPLTGTQDSIERARATGQPFEYFDPDTGKWKRHNPRTGETDIIPGPTAENSVTPLPRVLTEAPAPGGFSPETPYAPIRFDDTPPIGRTLFPTAPEAPPFGTPPGAFTPFVPETGGAVGDISRSLFDTADLFERQAAEFSLSPLVEAGAQRFAAARERLGRERQATLGEIEGMFNRNRISGSALAAASLASAGADFDIRDRELAVEEANFTADAKLRELSARADLTQRAAAARTQGFNVKLDALFKTAQFAQANAQIQAQLVDSSNRLKAAMAEIAEATVRIRMQLLQREAESIRTNLTNITLENLRGATARDVAEISGEAELRAGRERQEFERDVGLGGLLTPIVAPAVSRVGELLADRLFQNIGWTDIGGTSYRGSVPAGLGT